MSGRCKWLRRRLELEVYRRQLLPWDFFVFASHPRAVRTLDVESALAVALVAQGRDQWLSTSSGSGRCTAGGDLAQGVQRTNIGRLP